MIKQKNRLKDLIYIQENKTCNKQTIKGLVRTMLEPVLDTPAAGIVMYRLNNKDGLESLVRRLDYANVDVYDFSKNSTHLKDEIWENTEFVYVLTERFGVSFIWDYDMEEVIEDRAGFYLLYNSRDLCDSFDVIKENCVEDIQWYQEKYKPDRRDNVLMNISLRKVVDMLNETNQEVMISTIEQNDLMKSDATLKKLEFQNKKSSYVAHELKNQLSIIEMYSDILKKTIGENSQLDCIKKALKIATNSIMDLKSLNSNDLKDYNLKDLVKAACDLAKVYAEGKQIDIIIENNIDANILVDENKFLGVVVNLIKNAAEAIEENGKINIKTAIDDEKRATVLVSNTGIEITKERQAKIFDEGFTTKLKGTGLGLYISKTTMEEQFGNLKLLKSDDVSTDFEISIPIVD